MKQHQTPFTGYYGKWSAVSKQFVFGIQESSPRKARERLIREIGKDSFKYRFSAKKIKDCAEHFEMFRSGLKRKKNTRRQSGA